MKIKTITNRIRRDFRAIYECEHCGDTYEASGYDDANFHKNVIPRKECKKCGKSSQDEYRALTTKYPDGFQV